MVQIYRTSFHYMARRMMPCTFLNVFNFTLFWIFNFSCFDCEPHFISDSDIFFVCVLWLLWLYYPFLVLRKQNLFLNLTYSFVISFFNNFLPSNSFSPLSFPIFHHILWLYFFSTPLLCSENFL